MHNAGKVNASNGENGRNGADGVGIENAVVDENGKFSGAIDLKDLIIARQSDTLDSIIIYSYPYFYADEKIFRIYNSSGTGLCKYDESLLFQVFTYGNAVCVYYGAVFCNCRICMEKG